MEKNKRERERKEGKTLLFLISALPVKRMKTTTMAATATKVCLRCTWVHAI